MRLFVLGAVMPQILAPYTWHSLDKKVIINQLNYMLKVVRKS